MFLHNFTLIHADFDESYFLDDDDDDNDDDGDNDDDVHDGNCRDRTAELKRQHLSSIIAGLLRRETWGFFCPAHEGTWDFK